MCQILKKLLARKKAPIATQKPTTLGSITVKGFKSYKDLEQNTNGVVIGVAHTPIEIQNFEVSVPPHSYFFGYFDENDRSLRLRDAVEHVGGVVIKNAIYMIVKHEGKIIKF